MYENIRKYCREILFSVYGEKLLYIFQYGTYLALGYILKKFSFHWFCAIILFCKICVITFPISELIINFIII